MFPWYFQFSWRDPSLSPSAIPYFYALFIEKGPSCVSLLFSGTLCLVGCTFPFLPCLSLLFFLHFFVKPPQTTTLLFLLFFFWGMDLFAASCTVLWTSIHSSSGILFTRSNPLNLFSTSTAYSCVCEHTQSCLTVCNPMGPLFMGFPRQEYWSGLSLLSPGNLPNPGIKPGSLVSPALAGRFFTSWATREASIFIGDLI